MSITKEQDRPIVVGTPVEVEFAVNEIRKVLSGLTWISHPYFIAQRFIKSTEGRTFIYPETYCKTADDPSNKKAYHRLTPDNDYKGMFFFYVGTGRNDFEDFDTNFITYDVAIIFSVNLELINKVELGNGLFTQRLMKEARKLLTTTRMNHDFGYDLKTETRDLQECFREFRMKELQSYNRAPMQCFRFDIEIQIEEDCI